MQQNKLGYRAVDKLTGVATIKSGPGGLFSISVTGTPGGVTIFDGLDIMGDDVLFSVASASAGDVFHFGGHGIAANTGITVWALTDVVVAYT